MLIVVDTDLAVPEELDEVRIDLIGPGGETRRATDTPGTVTTPENGIYSTLNSGTTVQSTENYKPYQGTSMAAPHIAGLAALLKSAKSTLTPAEIESAIKTNARIQAGLLRDTSPVLGGAIRDGLLKIVSAFYDLRTGAEGLGLPLEEHAGNVIRFLREKADVLGLRGTF